MEWRIIALNFTYAVLGVILMYAAYRIIDLLELGPRVLAFIAAVVPFQPRRDVAEMSVAPCEHREDHDAAENNSMS